MLRKGLFTLNGNTHYWGYHDPDTSWNGFACPYFTKDVAVAILKELSREGYYDYTVEGDQLHLYLHEEQSEVVVPIEYKGLTLYPLGYKGWTWSAVEPINATIYHFDGMPLENDATTVTIETKDQLKELHLDEFDAHELSLQLDALGEVVHEETEAGRDSLFRLYLPLEFVEELSGWLLP